tara:strand:- start:8 stop:874 length:867 start_codon:yes stop_codon:yes gene_type:complete
MVKKKKIEKKEKKPSKKKKKSKEKVITTLNLKQETDIAMDFATKVYKQFNKIVKSVVLFGSVAKQHAEVGSDIDIIIVIDDVSIKWDQELIAWYREELDKIIRKNPYQKDLHINTIKLSTWWEDLLRGDPTLLNILRYGEPLIDFAGFFVPLKYLLITGKIKATPEAIYSCLKRAPQHIGRSKSAELATIEGLYWAMVDSAHAALMTANVSPPSPEHIAIDLKDVFVVNKMLKSQYVEWFRDLLMFHKKIAHGQVSDLKGVEIDLWQQRAEEFLQVMTELVKNQISEK